VLLDRDLVVAGFLRRDGDKDLVLPCSLKEPGEMTIAGRRFEELRSVKGKATRTMSPRL
jgi:hypothetical protein